MISTDPLRNILALGCTDPNGLDSVMTESEQAVAMALSIDDLSRIDDTLLARVNARSTKVARRYARVFDSSRKKGACPSFRTCSFPNGCKLCLSVDC